MHIELPPPWPIFVAALHVGQLGPEHGPVQARLHPAGLHVWRVLAVVLDVDAPAEDRVLSLLTAQSSSTIK